MSRLYILLIISTLIISCNTFNASKSKEELLLGNWFGGAGTKYSVNKGTERWIQDLAAGNALFVYGNNQIFMNHSANTKSTYELKGNKIYSDTDKPDKKRYYVIESLTSD